jgi:hypothetical protein
VCLVDYSIEAKPDESPVRLSYWPSPEAAGREARISRLETTRTYDVKYTNSVDLQYPQPAPADTKPQYVLVVLGRDDTELNFLNVTFWHTKGHACDAMARLLLSPEYEMTNSIEGWASEEELADLLDADGDLKDEHCTNEETVRSLIKKFLGRAEVNFQINAIGGVRGPRGEPATRQLSAPFSPAPSIPKRRKSAPSHEISPNYCLCVHPAMGCGGDRGATPGDLTYYSTHREAQKEGDAHSSHDCGVFPVQLAASCRDIEGAKPKVCLRLLHRSNFLEAPANVSFYPSVEGAIEAVALLLVGEEYFLNTAITKHGTPEDRDLLLGANNQLKGVHYTDAPLLRWMIKHYLVGRMLDFQINDVGCVRDTTPKRQRV